MKQNSENICKFVIDNHEGTLTATNFVFEKNAAASKKTFIRSNEIMYLAVSGRGFLCTDYLRQELLPGTLFFTFSGKPFRIEDAGGIQYMYISFCGQRTESLFDRFGISPASCVFHGCEGLLPFWQSAISRANGRNLDLISESVLIYTFSQMEQAPEDSERYLVGRIIRQVEASFSDPDLTLAACAEFLGYNPKYISRVFRQNMGVTFSDYLKSIRIRHAVFLMDQGVNVIKNVALLSGYRDPLYFSSVFRQVVGMPPTAYAGRIRSPQEKKDNTVKE